MISWFIFVSNKTTSSIIVSSTNKIRKRKTGYIGAVWIALNPTSASAASTFLLFFFFFHFTRFVERQETIITVAVLFMGPTATLFKKNILKMGPTILFTHLKIILLQWFQFSVSTTIISIQTNPLIYFFS